MSSITKATLKNAIGQFKTGKVLVLGDVAIDEMVNGHTDRLSREAPVLILRHDETRIILGAAGNAAHNIATLGAKQASIIGVAGKDYHCSLLLDALQRDGAHASGFVQDENRPTTTQSRISGIANHSVTQQIVRVDRESRVPVTGKTETALLDQISKQLPGFDVVLLSDYGLGVLTPGIIEHAQKLAKKHGVKVVVDSQQDLRLFQEAVVITPNQPEAEHNVGYALDTHEKLLSAGKELLGKTRAQNILITRGASGMSLFENTGAVTHVPVFNKSDVFDVTGAGDTVVGTISLAIATGTPMPEATVLGNLAASIVVKRFGAAVTNIPEIQSAIESLNEKLLAGIETRKEISV